MLCTFLWLSFLTLLYFYSLIQLLYDKILPLTFYRLYTSCADDVPLTCRSCSLSTPRPPSLYLLTTSYLTFIPFSLHITLHKHKTIISLLARIIFIQFSRAFLPSLCFSSSSHNLLARHQSLTCYINNCSFIVYTLVPPPCTLGGKTFLVSQDHSARTQHLLDFLLHISPVELLLHTSDLACGQPNLQYQLNLS